MSDNNVSSYSSINELSRLSSLISFSILRNPIYPSTQIEGETAKQMIIAHLPNLIHLNRVLIARDERRGAEIDYLQRHAQDYFDQKLDFLNEHTQYKKLIEKHGEPSKPSTNEVSFFSKYITPNRSNSKPVGVKILSKNLSWVFSFTISIEISYNSKGLNIFFFCRHQKKVFVFGQI